MPIRSCRTRTAKATRKTCGHASTAITAQRLLDAVPARGPAGRRAGGGPAGLELARVAALRGHKVTLCEKEEKLGGQINIASVPPFMQEMSLLAKHLAIQVEKVGVQVELGVEVTAELLDERKPDVLVVATGAVPVVPEDLPGIDNDKVVTAWDILAGHEAGLARKVVIIGGGLVGCETADFLAQTSDNKGVAATDVTLLEMHWMECPRRGICLWKG